MDSPQSADTETLEEEEEDQINRQVIQTQPRVVFWRRSGTISESSAALEEETVFFLFSKGETRAPLCDDWDALSDSLDRAGPFFFLFLWPLTFVNDKLVVRTALNEQ